MKDIKPKPKGDGEDTYEKRFKKIYGREVGQAVKKPNQTAVDKEVKKKAESPGILSRIRNFFGQGLLDEAAKK
jgi:hypothetical protein